MHYEANNAKKTLGFLLHNFVLCFCIIISYKLKGLLVHANALQVGAILYRIYDRLCKLILSMKGDDGGIGLFIIKGIFLLGYSFMYLLGFLVV